MGYKSPDVMSDQRLVCAGSAFFIYHGGAPPSEGVTYLIALFHGVDRTAVTRLA